MFDSSVEEIRSEKKEKVEKEGKEKNQYKPEIGDNKAIIWSGKESDPKYISHKIKEEILIKKDYYITHKIIKISIN